MLEISKEMALGWELERSANWLGAEEVYRELTKRNGACIEGWFRLGMVCLKQQKFADAVRYMQQTLEIDPNFAEAWSNQGVALASQRQFQEAEVAFRRAIELNPVRADLHRNMGNVQRDLGRFSAAATSLQRSLEIEPSSVAGRHSFAITLWGLGNLDQAISALLELLAEQPACQLAITSLNHFSQTLRSRIDTSVDSEPVRSLSKSLSELHNGWGVLLAIQGRVTEALDEYRKAHSAWPESPDAYVNLCNSLLDLGRIDEAEESLAEAIRLYPKNASNHLNLGYLRAQRDRLDEAVHCYQTALLHNPDYAEVHNNLGIVYGRQRMFLEASQSYENAIRVKADFEGAHYNLALIHLLQGDWERGWEEFEWRLRFKDRASLGFREPLWDGSSLKDRTILLQTEQGRGDTIQFIRYAPIVKALGGRVVLECPQRFIPLLATCHGVDQFVPTGTMLPSFDVYAPLMSLPRILRTTEATIPREIPYLHAESERVPFLLQNLVQENEFKIGLAWRGSPTYKRDRQRSAPLAEFEPLARVENVRLFSLQKGDGTQEIEAVANLFQVIDLGSKLDEGNASFVDTAAVIKQLDLVISVDSALAHLAGALGEPVWVALNHECDWRWMLERDDSPWYPTARLFRQAGAGRWKELFERMAGEVQKLVQSGKSRSE